MPRARSRHRAVVVSALAGSLLVSGCGSQQPGKPDPVAAQHFVVPKFLQAAITHASWNPNVSCRATVTTLRRVLGKARGPRGGATFAGGSFKPGIPDRRALHPPCRSHRIPTFVELDRVRIGSCRKINADGDWTCVLTDPRLTGPMDMRAIHIETDQKFRHRRGWSVPPGGTPVSIQGFVFWDPGHTNAAWHHHSGWEIHSFTAWRRAG
jgi:hypothetical protein